MVLVKLLDDCCPSRTILQHFQRLGVLLLLKGPVGYGDRMHQATAKAAVSVRNDP